VLLQFFQDICYFPPCPDPPPIKNPTKEAGLNIKALVNQPGTHIITEPVEFTREEGLFAGRTIASLSGSITEQQICLDVSPELKSLFEKNEGYFLYTSNKPKFLKLILICDFEDKIDATVNAAGLNNVFPNCKGGTESNLKCFVSVIPAN